MDGQDYPTCDLPTLPGPFYYTCYQSKFLKLDLTDSLSYPSTHLPRTFFHIYTPTSCIFLCKVVIILKKKKTINKLKGAMIGALSMCRNAKRYERLVEEPVPVVLLEGKLKRVNSLPAVGVRGSSNSCKCAPQLALQKSSRVKQSSSTKVSKSHPIFSLSDSGRKKKITARPEFARYLQYVKEGGVWL